MEEKAALVPLEVAQVTLKAVAAEKLYVVLPERARFLWRFKRLLPNRFWPVVKVEAERRIAEIDKGLKG
jgi:hypothetical protein